MSAAAPCTRDGWTAGGRPVHFARPGLTEIHWDDLITHLARVCRYQGAREVSVLAHLALATELGRRRGLPGSVLAYIAAHDLHEAYIGDLHPAMKALCPEFAQLEERWEAHVHQRLGLLLPCQLPAHVRAVVKLVDRLTLRAEMAAVGLPVASGPALLTRDVALARELLLARVPRLRHIVRSAIVGAPGLSDEAVDVATLVLERAAAAETGGAA